MYPALRRTILEYLLVVVPVAVYVWIVSLLSANTEHAMFASPEWNIATIFLAVSGVYSIMGDMARSKRSWSISVVGMLIMAVAVITVGAVVNIVLSIPTPRMNATRWMWGEYVVVSLLFFLFVTGARVVEDTRRE